MPFIDERIAYVKSSQPKSLSLPAPGQKPKVRTSMPRKPGAGDLDGVMVGRVNRPGAKPNVANKVKR